MHRTWIEIDERALASNLQTLRALAPSSRFCAVVKANAYGHGLREVAMILGREGVDAFAVDSLAEARAVRDLFPGALVIVLGYTLLSDIEEAVALGLELTIYDEAHLFALETAAAKRAKETRYHVKIETGTARQGILLEELGAFLDTAERCPHALLNGISTHFANIEDTSDTRFAEGQAALFQSAVERVQAAGFSPKWIHCACSAAIVLYPDTHGTLVRAGISLYGHWSSELTEKTARQHLIPTELSPALTWKTRIAQVKTYPGGTPIGYGLTETLKTSRRIAVLPVGYADGYDRGLSSVGEVIVGGFRCRVIGRVCMNMLMIDVSSVPNAEPEMEVTLLGRSGRHEISAEKIAETLKTISYEVLARLPAHIPRAVV